MDLEVGALVLQAALVFGAPDSPGTFEKGLFCESVGLVERVGVAFLAGLAVALGLVWYLSRRLTEPVLALSRAADEVAERRYGTELPEPSASGDEIAQLTERFREMTGRLAEAEAHTLPLLRFAPYPHP